MAPVLRRVALAPMVVLALAGCAGLPTVNLPTSALSLGPLPPADSVLADEAPTAVYAKIAQKALICWMGAKGPLKATHIFHAEAASPTSGGHAEVAIHDRDLTQNHPWGGRAFRIAFTPEGGGTNTRLDMQNIKLKRDMADALRADVIAWSRGKDSCQAQVLQPPPPEPVATPAKPKLKKSKAS